MHAIAATDHSPSRYSDHSSSVQSHNVSLQLKNIGETQAALSDTSKGSYRHRYSFDSNSLQGRGATTGNIITQEEGQTKVIPFETAAKMSKNQRKKLISKQYPNGKNSKQPYFSPLKKSESPKLSDL